jgi:hypothetical protein
VSRNLLRVSLLSLVMLAAALPASIAKAAAISYAEGTVRLVRDTNFYVATRGAKVLNGDIIETGASVIQLEGMGGVHLAIGPASRVYVKLAGDTAELSLLSGWLMLQPGAAASAISITAGSLRVVPEAGSLIIHTTPGKTALFVETGTPSVIELQDGKQVRTSKMSREQYAVRSSKEALKVLPRAPKDFLSGMPPAFFDPLVIVSFKGTAAAPRLERAAVFASDVAPWLSEDPAAFQLLNRRFNPPPKRLPVPSAGKPAQPAPPAPPSPRDNPIY